MNNNTIFSEYKLVINYKDNPVLRDSFNLLTKETYGFDFEDWYQNGYWSENYIPYSLVFNNQVIANASVNLMYFDTPYGLKHFIQIGTVMTHASFRNQGLSRYLIQYIISEYREKTDGIYLFANDSVLNFYPKFGFKKSQEYEYSKQIKGIHTKTEVIKVDMDCLNSREEFIKALSVSQNIGPLTMKDNPGLILFYTTSFMKNAVYYIKSLNTYVIAEIEEGILYLHDIISKESVTIQSVIDSMADCSVKKVILTFSPYTKESKCSFESLESKDSLEVYDITLLEEKDTTLFVLGDGFDMIEKDKLRFPFLSHA